MRFKVLKLVFLVFAVLSPSLLSAYSTLRSDGFLSQVLATHFMRSAITSHNLALQGDHSTLFTGAICDRLDEPYKCYLLRTLVLSRFEKVASAYQAKRIELEDSNMPKPFILATKEALRDFAHALVRRQK
ncbi:hypothetical protein NHP21005_14400 [Helicobacter sp. NHP21005]|uniref:hypothetical protein n=1 Tax=Helicobacter felistomachi TaxID=3040201 RepID=UPI00257477A9|nr:hypothetical protein [Helicobacter sp. NHP21005]BEG57752.1 hypothetical protein NHP21005_14400 [Helicobacter sp. NHP21005]